MSDEKNNSNNSVREWNVYLCEDGIASGGLAKGLLGCPEIMVREVIPPVIKELPDCDGLWAKKTESDYLVYGVKVKDVPTKHRKGQYIHIDPIIKQAFKDAEE